MKISKIQMIFGACEYFRNTKIKTRLVAAQLGAGLTCGLAFAFPHLSDEDGFVNRAGLWIGCSLGGFIASTIVAVLAFGLKQWLMGKQDIFGKEFFEGAESDGLSIFCTIIVSSILFIICEKIGSIIVVWH